MQLSKRNKYSDLKKRIVDCINAQREKLQVESATITEADVRLWKFSDDKKTLVDSCSNVSATIDSDHNMTQDGEDNKDPDLEVNSGV